MAKFHGIIGYAERKETSPDVWTDVITDHTYSGDVISNTASWQAGANLNDNLMVSNTISIVADSYANANVSAMRYVNWHGVDWEIIKFTVQRPRIILMLGGVYNRNKAST